MTNKERDKLIKDMAKSTPGIDSWENESESIKKVLLETASRYLIIAETAIRNSHLQIVQQTSENIENSMSRMYDHWAAGEICEETCRIVREAILQGKAPKKGEYDPEW